MVITDREQCEECGYYGENMEGHICWEFLDDDDMCSYCAERPVFEHFMESCWKCTFVCQVCEDLIPYEKGVAWDDLCDDCGVKVDSTPESPYEKGE